jgi:hypothetical protein
MRVIAVPRELKPTSPAFLRGHYSTGVREVAAMAVYAASVGSDPRVVQNGGRPRWRRARRLSRTRPAGPPVNRIPIRPSHRTRRRLQQSESLDRRELARDSQISISIPISTTWATGMQKYASGRSALRCMKA